MTPIFESGIIRRLSLTDEAAARSHLRRLSPADRRLRFGGTVGDPFLATYARSLFAQAHLTLGYEVAGEIRGLGELVIAPPAGIDAEIALSVEAAARNRGIGTMLLRRLLLMARNRSVATVRVLCLRDNAAMQAVARKADADLRYEEGEVIGRLSPVEPSAFSLGAEASQEGTAVLRWMLRRGAGAPRPDEGDPQPRRG